MVGGNYQVTVTLTPQRRFFRLTHEPPTPPEIHFFNNDQGEFFLQWTTSMQGWYLQESPEISPDSWNYSPLVPTVVGDNYQVAYTPSIQRRFFRLTRQPPPIIVADPQLQIHADESGQIILEWSADPPGWSLQESPDLSPDSWTGSTTTPTLEGDHYRRTINPTGGQRFFRLKSP
jgi:hypothetical protein